MNHLEDHIPPEVAEIIEIKDTVTKHSRLRAIIDQTRDEMCHKDDLSSAITQYYPTLGGMAMVGKLEELGFGTFYHDYISNLANRLGVRFIPVSQRAGIEVKP